MTGIELIGLARISDREHQNTHHLGREGGHIHFTTISEEYGRQWALKAFFSDDKLLTQRQKEISLDAGKFGAVRESIKTEGGEVINVAIKLRTEPDF